LQERKHQLHSALTRIGRHETTPQLLNWFSRKHNWEPRLKFFFKL